jgi:hypothetical protein
LERSAVNNKRFYDASFYGGGWFSINDIKNLISTGQITDSSDLSRAYILMYQNAKYPLIDFSLMVSFFTNFQTAPSDPASAWSIRSTSVDMAYSYLFITAMIAIIALIFQLLMCFETLLQSFKEKKYHLSTKYPNNFLSYKLFNVNMMMNFMNNLAIVFAFFNFLSTLIVIAY